MSPTTHLAKGGACVSVCAPPTLYHRVQDFFYVPPPTRSPQVDDQPPSHPAMSSRGEEKEDLRMAAARSIKPGWTPQALLTWRPKGDKPEKKHLWAACKERNPALKENQLRDKQGMVDWLSLNGAPSDADRSGETSVFVMEINLDGNLFMSRRLCAAPALSARCSPRAVPIAAFACIARLPPRRPPLSSSVRCRS